MAVSPPTLTSYYGYGYRAAEFSPALGESSRQKNGDVLVDYFDTPARPLQKDCGADSVRGCFHKEHIDEGQDARICLVRLRKRRNALLKLSRNNQGHSSSIIVA